MTVMEIKSFSSSFVKGVVLAVATVALVGGSAFSAAGNVENGAKVYMKKCWWCHGEEGEADGPAAEFMMPPPRDFSAGVYKYKTSPPDAEIPRDEDLFVMISNGMPGTSMPSWKEVLSEQERWDLVAYIKTFTDMFEDMDNPPALSLAGKIPSTPDSITKGAKAYEAGKCFECHGERGKGNTQKKLKEGSGAKLWPRNLTKQWTFRAGTTPENLFARVTNGIPNTPMPAFAAETTANGKLSVEDRWHVVNYVMSLADPTNQVSQGQIVIKGVQRPAIPADEKDAVWDGVEATTFRLAPQIIQKERFFTPANDLISVKAVFTDKDIAFLLQWDDRTQSIPGEEKSGTLAWGPLGHDAVAIQTPVTPSGSSEKPYFGHGDGKNPVSMLYWKSQSATDPAGSMLMTATGNHKREMGDAESIGFTTSSSYEFGTWKVMMKRSLVSPNTEKDTQFVVGKYIPVAFANWDGSNGEAGSKHTMTTWYWLLLKPAPSNDVVVIPAMIFALLFFGQYAFSRFAGDKKNKA